MRTGVGGIGVGEGDGEGDGEGRPGGGTTACVEAGTPVAVEPLAPTAGVGVLAGIDIDGVSPHPAISITDNISHRSAFCTPCSRESCPEAPRPQRETAAAHYFRG